MANICFFLMTEKGYITLKDFLSEFESSQVAFVVSSKDNNVKEDYFDKIKELCEQNKVPFYSRSTFNLFEVHDEMLKVAIGWRWLIEDNNNLIVLHDSLLPRYRGFAPLVSALINGDEEVGVSAIWADKDYDKGDILMQKKINITYPVKIETVINSISKLYSQIVIEIFKKKLSGSPIVGIPQDDNFSTYSLWRDEEDYYINWHWDADSIQRKVNALGFPYMGAKTFIGKEQATVYEVKVVTDVIVEHRQDSVGKVIFVIDGFPVVVCGKGLLLIKELVNSKTGSSLIPTKKLRVRYGRHLYPFQ